jgi:hypothetical protein
MRRYRVIPLLGLIAVMLLAGCAAPGNDVASAGVSQPPGFWMGLWHGFISPVTLIISWFSDTVGIYAVHNRGGWYDFGFMIGVSIVLGGPCGGRGARKRRAGKTSRGES